MALLQWTIKWNVFNWGAKIICANYIGRKYLAVATADATITAVTHVANNALY